MLLFCERVETEAYTGTQEIIIITNYMKTSLCIQLSSDVSLCRPEDVSCYEVSTAIVVDESVI